MPFVSTQNPLNRRGSGPGVIVITEDTLQNGTHSLSHEWAREGFAVAHVTVGLHELPATVSKSLDDAIDALLALWACSDKMRFGVIGMRDTQKRGGPCS